MTGFTEVDLREMLEYYRANEFDFDVESVLRQMADWYDHYVFARGTKNDGMPVKSVASPILVLAYMLYFVRNHAVPDDLVDKNLRTDYAKIRHVITESRKLNGNYHKLEDIIADGGTTGLLVDSFQAREIAKGDNFVSFLYYMGLLTIGGSSMGEIAFRIPNLTVAEFMHDFIPKAYEDVNGIDPRIFDISKGLYAFARRGDWHKALETACEQLARSARDKNIAREWNLKPIPNVTDGVPGGTVGLCRLLVVFHGGRVVACEEV